ncbi:hypothetical protein ACJRO7_031486 [Eucalyptus globulus]|uniref:Protein kinase domain-containing protein n=1 Tax=Eucalyptus globulus TaxID=34317 RepID=A0ABD3JI82_EUCGL
MMISSSWGAPSAFTKGFNPQHMSDGLYGRHLHVYSWPDGELKQTLDLGDTGSIPLEIRFLHDPSKDMGFVGCAWSSNMVRFFKTQDGSWSHEVAISVEPLKVQNWILPVMPGLITDFLISLDDRYLYFVNWLHGDERQYNIEDHEHPEGSGIVAENEDGMTWQVDLPEIKANKLRGGPTATPVTMATGSLRSLALLLQLLLLLSGGGASAKDCTVMSKILVALKPSGWSSSQACCNWKGVSCDSSSRVTGLNLPSSSLSGALPSDLSFLSHLQTLSLHNNLLSGPVPSFAGVASLETLYLNNNNFTSITSGAFQGLTSLQTLNLSNNLCLAPWQIPLELNASTSLVTLYATNANIVGPIPDFLGSLPSLVNLRISYNNLTGPLPSSFGTSGIKILCLNNQAMGLSGGISVLAGMTQLRLVWLENNQDNQFTGVVPASLLALPGLKNVSLDNNKLQGPVPSNRSGIDITYGGTNSFCNSAPGPCDPQVTMLLEVASALGYPITLADSWTGNDACHGSWSAISCQGNKVTAVTFSKRGFSGTISPAFADLTLLDTLLLNDNNLTGSIPDSLTTLTQLHVLDVSNNNLSGLIPVFPASMKLTTTGNPLIGEMGTGSGGGGSGSGTNSSDGGSPGRSNGSSLSGGVIFAVVVIGILIFIGVVVVGFYKYYIIQRHRTVNRVHNPEIGMEVANNGARNGMNGCGGVSSELPSQSRGDHSDFPVFKGGNVKISIEVLRQATHNFSEENNLGSGGFGVVYKGELHDGTKIAVKRMESGAMGTKGMNEFQAEIAVLTTVRHRHLVALLGYCIEGHERLLVYEYMPQGTLAQHLFEWQEKGYAPLTWKRRVTIALDVARGVEYLHSLAQQKFIHRDLKPENILLGDDMRAKVADFGLVKHVPDGKYSVETPLAGTFGYLAPEYVATGKVTTKVDVYAFGVVLMEIITGRKALDNTVSVERVQLVAWFRRVLINKENIRKAIDQTLDPDEETLESIIKVAELAGHCTAREPFQRPDMDHAVNILGPAVEQWKPTSHDEEESSGINLHMNLPQALQRWQADEGTSSAFNSMSFSNTQSSIPLKPLTFPDSFSSTDCR